MATLCLWLTCLFVFWKIPTLGSDDVRERLQQLLEDARKRQEAIQQQVRRAFDSLNDDEDRNPLASRNRADEIVHHEEQAAVTGETDHYDDYSYDEYFGYDQDSYYEAESAAESYASSDSQMTYYDEEDTYAQEQLKVSNGFLKSPRKSERGSTASGSSGRNKRLADCTLASDFHRLTGCLSNSSHMDCSLLFDFSTLSHSPSLDTKKDRDDANRGSGTRVSGGKESSQEELIQQARKRQSDQNMRKEEASRPSQQRQRQQQSRQPAARGSDLAHDLVKNAQDMFDQLGLAQNIYKTAPRNAFDAKADEMHRQREEMKRLEESLYEELSRKPGVESGAASGPGKKMSEDEERRKPVGPFLKRSCESLICDSCVIIVKEFALAVFAAIHDSKYRYISDVLKTFCRSPAIAKKYVAPIGDICELHFVNSTRGFRPILVTAFDAFDPDWSELNSQASVVQKTKEVCLAVGACDEDHFKFHYEDATLNHQADKEINGENMETDVLSPQCQVCQAFTSSLEGMAVLSLPYSEDVDDSLIVQTCDAIHGFGDDEREICRGIVNRRDEFSWMINVHREKVKSRLPKESSERYFSDRVCQDIKYCEKPKEKRQQSTEEVEIEYF